MNAEAQDSDATALEVEAVLTSVRESLCDASFAGALALLLAQDEARRKTGEAK
jgi:hypothetical protein